jgi:uncharacterized protein (TIGR03435 family)
MTGCGQTMEQLANILNGHTDRKVLDMTGLTGKFDYEIPLVFSDGDRKAAVLASVLEHLKLKLESRKGPIECLVVDHVERPAEN